MTKAKIKTVEEKAVDLVKKLMANANDPSVTEAEAMAFIAKAQEILERHNLSFLDVPADDVTEAIGEEHWAPTYGGDTWRQAVANAAARVYMCKLMYKRTTVTNSRGKVVVRLGYILVGRESSKAVARAMIDYLFATAIRLSMAYSPKDQTARRLFERGLGIRLVERLRAMYNDHAEPSKAPAGSNLPALYKAELDLVTDYIAEHHAPRQKAFKGVRVDGNHSENGKAAANTISLSGQINGGSPASKLLLT